MVAISVDKDKSGLRSSKTDHFKRSTILKSCVPSTAALTGLLFYLSLSLDQFKEPLVILDFSS